jgi:SAM-dependent methyltransferase
MDNSLNYQNTWVKPQYIATKVETFNILEGYLKQPPKRILDIGCGFAKVSELFQKKYGTELYLMEGDMDKSAGKRIGKFGTIDNFQWYLPVERMKQEWDANGMIYTHVDGNNINIPADIKFDVIYSWLSCGFHYPARTYRDLILKHSTPETVVVMDFRVGTMDQQIDDFETITVLRSNPKSDTRHIRFK